MKRTNSLPLSPIVLTRPPLVQVLRSTVALNSYLGFSALYIFFFALCIKFNKGGNSCSKILNAIPIFAQISEFRCFHETKETQNGLERFFYNLAEFVFEYFHDSRRIWASSAKFFFSNIFSRHDGTVLPVPVTSTSARSNSPPSPTRVFWHNKFLHTPLPACSFSDVHGVVRSPHGNERSRVNTWSV